jgi:CRISPR/Cas system-associated protein Csx1
MLLLFLVLPIQNRDPILWIKLAISLADICLQPNLLISHDQIVEIEVYLYLSFTTAFHLIIDLYFISFVILL